MTHKEQTANPVRVVMDEVAFSELVHGEVVKLRSANGTEVEILLSDIGFITMARHVCAAMQKGETDTSLPVTVGQWARYHHAWLAAGKPKEFPKLHDWLRDNVPGNPPQ